MKYVVLSPKNKLICFDHSDQVAEYCLEKNNEALDVPRRCPCARQGISASPTPR